MFVADVMQSKVVTVTARTPVVEAIRLVSQRRIRHLPVVENDQLLGIVSDRDLKRAIGALAADAAQGRRDVLEHRTVGDIMTRRVITAIPTFPVEEAARVMVEAKISALPVIEGGRLIGIVTETDVLDLVVRAMGAGEPSSRLDVTLGAEPSALADVVAAIERAGAPITSVVTLKNREGLKLAIVRIATINPGPALASLQRAGFTVRGAFERSEGDVRQTLSRGT